jgi:hypothetical protein
MSLEVENLPVISIVTVFKLQIRVESEVGDAAVVANRLEGAVVPEYLAGSGRGAGQAVDVE